MHKPLFSYYLAATLTLPELIDYSSSIDLISVKHGRDKVNGAF